LTSIFKLLASRRRQKCAVEKAKREAVERTQARDRAKIEALERLLAQTRTDLASIQPKRGRAFRLPELQSEASEVASAIPQHSA
jgi:hypothetical protein